MSRTRGHNCRRYLGHKEWLAEKAAKKDARRAREPEPEELNLRFEIRTKAPVPLTGYDVFLLLWETVGELLQSKRKSVTLNRP